MEDNEKLEAWREACASAASLLPSIQTCLTNVQVLISWLKSDEHERERFVYRTGLPPFVRKLEENYRDIGQITADDPKSILELDVESVNKIQNQLRDTVTAATRAMLRWDILQRCHRFVSLSQAFQGSTKEQRKRQMEDDGVVSAQKGRVGRLLKGQAKVEVDVVDNGLEWIVVKAAGRDRLARQMADSGWSWGEHELGDEVDEEEWEDVPLAKAVKRLVAASRVNRCDYQFPRIRVVLTGAYRSEKEFGILFEQIERVDPHVKVTIEDMASEFMSSPLPDLHTAIQNLVGDKLYGLTPTLNIDHTILIDLISDITHLKLEPHQWQALSTRSQIEEENSQAGGAMVKRLYPLLQGRRLVCTVEAAQHYHEVLKTVGTKTEKARGRLLVPFDKTTRAMSTEEIREAFQKLSIYPIPPDLQLPITVLPDSWTLASVEPAVRAGTLPNVALEVTRRSGWQSARLSIFMYGWASGNVTITSNKEIKGNVQTMVEEGRTDDLERGPRIWRFPVTRNLLAKHATPRGETEDEDEDQAGWEEGGAGLSCSMDEVDRCLTTRCRAQQESSEDE